MDISVIGGTGTAGRATVAALVARGHTVRALSRSAPAAGVLPPGVAHHVVDVGSGSGLRSALDGTEVVVECVNAPPAHAAPVLVDGVGRALAAAADAGVAHWVSLSVVGADRVPGRYYAAKLAQEAAVAQAAGVDTSLLRATQFPQLLDLVWASAWRTGVVPAPRGSLAPVDPRDLAEVLCDVAERGPGPRLEVGGPEAQPIAALARAWRRARGSRRPVLPVPALNAYLRAVAAGGLLPAPGAARGVRTFDAWLRERETGARMVRDDDIASISHHATRERTAPR